MEGLCKFGNVGKCVRREEYSMTITGWCNEGTSHERRDVESFKQGLRHQLGHAPTTNWGGRARRSATAPTSHTGM